MEGGSRGEEYSIREGAGVRREGVGEEGWRREERKGWREGWR